MSESIDLDDLNRVGVLVRLQLDDNWLADMIEIACDEIARLREERRWVPVGERSPELLQNVLVCSIRGIHFASLDLCGQWLDEDENPGKKISHWQPLPPGPEAKEPNRE